MCRVFDNDSGNKIKPPLVVDRPNFDKFVTTSRDFEQPPTTIILFDSISKLLLHTQTAHTIRRLVLLLLFIDESGEIHFLPNISHRYSIATTSTRVYVDNNK